MERVLVSAAGLVAPLIMIASEPAMVDLESANGVLMDMEVQLAHMSDFATIVSSVGTVLALGSLLWVARLATRKPGAVVG